MPGKVGGVLYLGPQRKGVPNRKMGQLSPCLEDGRQAPPQTSACAGGGCRLAAARRR